MGDVTPAGVIAESDTHTGWIQARGFDLALFTLSPLSGVLVVLAALHGPWGHVVAPSAVYFVAIPHYLSTFTFYMDDENLAYYKTRWLAFFAGPAICAAVVLAAVLSQRAALFQTVQFTWNIYHVALQSAGILGIYRWLNGGPASERSTATWAIVSTSAAMAFFHLERFGPMYGTLAGVHPMLPQLVFLVALTVAVPSVLIVATRLLRRPERTSLPELAFLATSLLLFHPYLWVDDSELATLGMLMGHFVQYLAIVWLLNRRKHAVPTGSTRQRALSAVSGHTSTLLATLVVTGTLFFFFDRVSRLAGVPWAYQIAWNIIVIMHFYLDGLLWAFKRRFVRESIGQYLILPDHRIQNVLASSAASGHLGPPPGGHHRHNPN